MHNNTIDFMGNYEYNQVDAYFMKRFYFRMSKKER